MYSHSLFRAAVVMASLATLSIATAPSASAETGGDGTCTKALGWCCDCWIQGGALQCDKLYHGTGVENCDAGNGVCPTNPDNWCII